MTDRLDQFQEWVEAKEGRTVEIKLGDYNNIKHFKIWAYDYGLTVGQFVNTVEEINLEAKKAKENLAAYEKLRAEFGGIK